MAIVFEWDIKKAQTNLIKHKVSFEEVASNICRPQFSNN